MTVTLTNPQTLEEQSESLRQQLGLEVAPKIINPDSVTKIFESGVLANVRVTAERFNFSIKLSDLGIVPTRENRKEKLVSAIDSVLRNSQRASLLPKDEMFHYVDGKKVAIPMPEITDRAVRFLFPTRYDEDKGPASASEASWDAIPLYGMTFIPLASWVRWSKQYEEAKTEHLRAAQLIVDNYDRLRSASVNHYVQIALDVYNRLQKTAPQQLTRTIQLNDLTARRFGGTAGESMEVQITPVQWVRRWKRVVLRAWPTKQDIINKYRVDAKFFWAPLPSKVAEDRILADEKIRNRNSENTAISQIRDVVNSTMSSQAHELTVSYVRTIVERTEMVFLGFLNFVQNDNRAISPRQLNAVLRVVDMISQMTADVSGLDGIKRQAELIEAYVEQSKSLLASSSNKKGRKSTAEEISKDLPSIIAQAVQIVREEAESLIGFEARRTVYSAEDPMQILASINSSQSGQSPVVRRASVSTEDDAVEFIEWEDTDAHEPLPLDEQEDELAAVRRVR
ncbi:hypothetical protein EBS67_00005 [bacterium]|nr:hypothetical protein [bacterium]NBT60673.1 hypothetical protein [Planctomycetia bacterium]